ncbi:BCAM0308 family protein [Pseudomonas boanensis]|uniref:BCAM0308 family protein n=1 Tax=Metapseudomonas boanensis TaxID=2822138 RepID=UPI0035D4935D
MDKHQHSEKNQLFSPQHGDPYLALPGSGTALCPQCGVTYHRGHWSWKSAAPADAHSVICPACRRIADDQPAGTLKLSGKFLSGHKEEILHLIHNIEAAEKAQHALERLLKVTDKDNEIEVTTTGMHLANRIGHALNGAFKGCSQYRYSEDENSVNISWERD